MFANLLFLAIVLLMTTLAPNIPASSTDLATGALIYTLTLVLIVLQNRVLPIRQKMQAILFLTNLELVFSLGLLWFSFAMPQALSQVPWIGKTQTFGTLVALLLYFGALGLFYASAYPHLITKMHLSRLRYVEQQLRFLVPFTLPFLLFSAISDLIALLPANVSVFENPNTPLAVIVSTGLTLALLAVMMAVFPAILVRAWQCQPLPPGPLRDRLDALCERSRFKHAGMLTWPVMGHSLTAAIIGIVPRFRYVMFTPMLIRNLSPESVEAVLAHEMGHHRRRHLLIYPFIFLGAMVLIGYLSTLVLPAVDAHLNLKHHLDPAGPWNELRPVALFVAYIGVIVVYFRVVFGFFSRLFERHADLAGFDIAMPPTQMRQALNEVGYLSGNIHDVPSWHHYSIRQRMEFLESTKNDPSLVHKHHRFVKKSLFAYFCALGIATVILLSAITDADHVLSLPRTWMESLSDVVDDSLNHGLRHKLALEYLQRENIEGDSKKIQEALEESLKSEAALEMPGAAELLTADLLLENHNPDAAAQFMTLAWQRYDFRQASPEIKQDFLDLTAKILDALEQSNPKSPHANELRQISKY